MNTYIYLNIHIYEKNEAREGGRRINAGDVDLFTSDGERTGSEDVFLSLSVSKYISISICTSAAHATATASHARRHAIAHARGRTCSPERRGEGVCGLVMGVFKREEGGDVRNEILIFFAASVLTWKKGWQARQQSRQTPAD